MAVLKELLSTEPRDRFGAMFRKLRVEYEKRGLPLSGRFELTPHCTLDCKMCYVHRADGKYPHRTLTGDEWIAIMDQAIELGMLRATLTGGECMLHPDFKRIYTHLKRHGVYVELLTNGTLIDEEMLAMLKEMPPRRVQISLYGSNPAVYERVTGRADAFDRVTTALRRLDEERIPTEIALTVSRYNRDDLEPLWNLAHRLTQGRVLVECDLFGPEVATDHAFSDYALTYEEQYAVRKQVFEWENGAVCDLCDEDFAELGSNDGTYHDTLPCAAGLSLLDVSYAGVMSPCNNFPLIHVNLQEHDVASAWKLVNQAAREYRRSEECRTCEYLGKCRFCAARYQLESDKPCDKRLHMLIPTLYHKHKK